MKNINAKEVLEIAIQNEKNGVKFYTNMAERAEKPALKEMFNGFVKDEANHVKVIKNLLNAILEEGKELSYYDDPEELLYLQAISGSVLFSDDFASPIIKEAMNDTLSALHYAVGIEIKSIEFYYQVVQLVASEDSKKVIGDLIVQEKGHVKSLYKMIKDCE
ncbi:ferritin family protein [Thermodesulfobacteriota bacterium]